MTRATQALKQLRRRSGDEHGVVLVLVAMLMVAFIGMGALAIDVGSFYQAKREAQSAADAAALAGAQDLPTQSTATAAAITYVGKNMPAVPTSCSATSPGICVTYPTSSQIQVVVIATTPSFLGRIFGITSATVSASAVAAAGGLKSAMFAMSTNCSNPIYLQQSNMTLIGGINSNGGIRQSGSNNTYGSGSYDVNPNPLTPPPVPCSFQDDTAGSGKDTYGGTSAPTPVSGPTTTWPENFISSFPVVPFTAGGDPNCKYIGMDLNLQGANGQVLPSGTYCYQTIEFNETGITCTCSFVASQSMTFNQGPDSFTPSFQDLGFYDMDSSSINVNANGFDFLNGGTLFFPNAAVTVNAPSGTLSSFIEAQTETVNGGGPGTWKGSGPASGGAASLVQ